jgi:hypothetical protein
MGRSWFLSKNDSKNRLSKYPTPRYGRASVGKGYS